MRPTRSSHDNVLSPGLEPTPLPERLEGEHASAESDGGFDSFALAGFSDDLPPPPSLHQPTIILHHCPPPPSEPQTLVGLPPPLLNHLRYTILELLGVGGMGAVYKATHRMMGRTVALKVISPRWVDDETAIARFRQEVRAAARLCHPNIVTAFDAEQAGDCHFLVMEFVEGVNLSRLVEEGGPLPIGAACEYLRQAAVGLQHAHEEGMVHRDIKPQNLMVTLQGHVKILDFGLARFASERRSSHNLEPSPAQITMAGEVLGTPDYLAPEQARNARGVDGRADLYSLGATMYLLLTGKVPFPAETGVEKLLRQCMDEPIPVEEWRPEVPRALGEIVRKLMAKHPEGRYQTARELAEALAPFAKAGAVPPQPRSITQSAVASPDAPTNPPHSPTPRPPVLAPEPMSPAPIAPVAPAAVPSPSSPPSRAISPMKVALCGTLGLLVAVGFAIFRSRGDGDGSKKPGGSVTPTNPERTTKTRPRVLYVLASRGFAYNEYAAVRKGLEEKGVELIVASSSTDLASPVGGTGSKPVKPDLLLGNVRVGDYDALVIGGGAGVSEFTGTSKDAPAARRVIGETMAARKPVAAIGLGPTVIAEAGVLRGKRVACAPDAKKKLVEAGAEVVPGAVATMESPEGNVNLITARDAQGAGELAEALAGVLRPAGKTP